MKLYNFAPAALVILLASCSYRPDCEDPGIWVRFVNADSTELAAITVKKYPKGQGFAQAMDSVTLNLSKDAKYAITTSEDWKFEMPEAGKVFRIDQITIIKDKGEKRSLFGAGELKNCTNGISYHVNETVYTQPTQGYYTRGQAGVIELYK